MAQQQFYTLQACQIQASERKTAYVDTVVHLFKSTLVPTSSTTKTELTAAEADYDDYAAITMAAWTGPILAPGSGYMILSPAVLFEVGVTDPVVPNVIGGFWIEDDNGVVRMVGIFADPLPMQLAGQGIPLNFVDLFPTGYTGA